MHVRKTEGNKELVSIITPVYNGDNYVRVLLESILSQTYDKIELILVDDGSKDLTKDVITEYKDRFSARSYLLVYLYQVHKGQAAAINTGLKSMHGEYVKWIDGDDFLTDDAVEKEVKYLTDHKETAMVMCGAKYISFETKKTIQVKPPVEKKYKADLFGCYIKGGNALPGSGSILVRKEALKKAIPSLHIFESPEGQNLQLMIPLSYSYQCGYIDEPLFIRTIRPDSHCQRARTYEEEKERNRNFVILINETLDRMDIEEGDAIKKTVRARFTRQLLYTAASHRKAKQLFSLLAASFADRQYRPGDLAKCVLYYLKGIKNA